MKKQVKLPHAVISQREYKRKYSLIELFKTYSYAPGAIRKLIYNRRKKLISKQFVERINLTVTEVNGCAACSYAHASMALRTGMSSEEITSFLKGEDRFVKPEEAKAILFAQHFAELRGYPKQDAFESLINEYGKAKARIIYSSAQLMLCGNIYGIPISAFQSRFKGKPYTNSRLSYELSMLVLGGLIIPFAILTGAFRLLIRLSNIQLNKTHNYEV